MRQDHDRGPRSQRGAFTLIELLVVLSIIAVLIAILLPTLQSAKEQTRRAQCLANLHQWSIALVNYAIEYDGRYPPAGLLWPGISTDWGDNFIAFETRAEMEGSFFYQMSKSAMRDFWTCPNLEPLDYPYPPYQQGNAWWLETGYNFRTPDMGWSKCDRLVGLDGEPKAELGTRKDGVPFVKFLAGVGQSPRPMGRRLCRDGDTQLLLADLQPRR